jgi:cystathionine beta-lyase
LLHRHVPGIGYVVPDATYLAWLDCRSLDLGEDPAEVFRRCGVELSPGPRFGDEGIGFARLNFATGAEVLTEIVAAMSSVASNRLP